MSDSVSWATVRAAIAAHWPSWWKTLPEAKRALYDERLGAQTRPDIMLEAVKRCAMRIRAGGPTVVDLLAEYRDLRAEPVGGNDRPGIERPRDRARAERADRDRDERLSIEAERAACRARVRQLEETEPEVVRAARARVAALGVRSAREGDLTDSAAVMVCAAIDDSARCSFGGGA